MPMLDVSPLSPLRPQASRISGTSTHSPGGMRASTAGVFSGSGTGACPAGTCTGTPSFSISTRGASCSLSMKKVTWRMQGAGLGRPPAPVVPGAQLVPAGAISRANRSSASFCGCITATCSTASRTSCVRACGPKLPCSEPSTSMRLRL